MRARLLFRSGTVLLVLLLPAVSFVQAPPNYVGPGAKYIGRTLTLRTPEGGERLTYDPNGKLVGSAPSGSWTLDGEIKVTDLGVDGSVLRIFGQRVFLASMNGDLVDIFADQEWKFPNNKVQRQIKDTAKVEIDIQNAAAWDETAIDDAILRIFLGNRENLAEHAPEYWKAYFCKRAKGMQAACDPQMVNNHRPADGGTVSAPRATSAPDPKYTAVAQKARFQGTTVLSLNIMPNGAPADIQIVQPLGLGLDDSAVAAVSQWRFKPAMHNGSPVPVHINVEVNFRLY